MFQPTRIVVLPPTPEGNTLVETNLGEETDKQLGEEVRVKCVAKRRVVECSMGDGATMR